MKHYLSTFSRFLTYESLKCFRVLIAVGTIVYVINLIAGFLSENIDIPMKINYFG